MVRRHFYNLRFEKRTKYWLFLIDCAFYEMKQYVDIEKNILFNSRSVEKNILFCILSIEKNIFFDKMNKKKCYH